MVRWTPLEERTCVSRGNGVAATAATGTTVLSGGGVAIAMGFAGFGGSFIATAGAASFLPVSGFAATPGSGSGGTGVADATLSGSFFAGAAAPPGNGSGGGRSLSFAADCAGAGDASSPGSGSIGSDFAVRRGAAGLGAAAASAPGSVSPGPGRASISWGEASSWTSFALTFETFAGSASGSLR